MNFASFIKKAHVSMAATSLLGGPSPEVKAELQRQGWQFKTHLVVPDACGMRRLSSTMQITLVTSPDGRDVLESSELRKKYREARYNAANKLFDL